MAERDKPERYAEFPDPRENIEAILNALPALVGYWDRTLHNRLANRTYLRFYGKTPEEVQGMHLRDLLGEELYEQNRHHVEGALAGEPQLFHREFTTSTGEALYTQASYIPDVADGEVRGFFVLVTDITEQRRIEQEVESSRTRLAEAERLARLGSWEWDIPDNRITCSQGFLDIYGIAGTDLPGTWQQGGSKYVHPDDRDLLDAEMRAAVEGGAPVEFEYRVIRPDGRVRRLHARAELTADAEGHPLRLTGTAQDVTEIRAAAEALRSLQEPPRQRDGELAKLLTPRQIEILSLIADGLNNAEISRRLYLSESTVKWHIRKILRALGVANRAQAVARYLSAAKGR